MKNQTKSIYLTVLVVSLGYFVDIFDLTLFNMLRMPSLKDIGVSEANLMNTGITLLNWQMAGMLIGGLFWGILGDKKGRLTVLFGSILTYSLANIANAFVSSVPQYAILRFISGVGLAGELGAGITLISEIMPTAKRGIGTTIVATIGVLGATVGGLVVEFFHWQTCYIIGGCLGLLLLLLRFKMLDSGLFESAKIKHHHVEWGNLKIFIKNKKLFKTLLHSISIGVPIWFIAGILMNFSPEYGQLFNISEPLKASRSIGISYLGLALGDFLSGLTSQYLKSRVRTVQIFMLLCLLFIGILLFTTNEKSAEYYYGICFLIGISAGYWAIFVTMASEQFGTNIRATAATSIPNFVRGAVIPMTLSFKYLNANIGIFNSTLIVGGVVFALAILSSFSLPESFHKDLDYID